MGVSEKENVKAVWDSWISERGWRKVWILTIEIVAYRKEYDEANSAAANAKAKGNAKASKKVWSCAPAYRWGIWGAEFWFCQMFFIE